MMSDCRNSVIKLKSNKSYDENYPYLNLYSTQALPEDVTFSVAKGKKWTDIINFYQGLVIDFFSQRLIDLFSAKMDMQDICYPIRIEGDDSPNYYVIYNLKQYEMVNPDHMIDGSNEPMYVYMPDGETPPPLFTANATLYKIISEETMQQMKKLKMTNIYYREMYTLNTAEYEEWKHLHAQNKPFLPTM